MADLRRRLVRLEDRVQPSAQLAKDPPMEAPPFSEEWERLTPKEKRLLKPIRARWQPGDTHEAWLKKVSADELRIAINVLKRESDAR